MLGPLEDRCTEHEQQIAALQQQIQDLSALLHTVLHAQSPDEEGEPAGRLLSLLATLTSRKKEEPMHPEVKRGYPLGTQRLVHFAKHHQIDSSQCKQLFWSREIPLTVYQRPGTVQRNKQEWWITPKQHRIVAQYLQEHHISFTVCSLCDQEDTMHHE